MNKAIFKVPNGKLIRISMEESGGKIAAVKITGDFFAYPEENIKKLEEYFAGTSLEKNALAARANEFEKKFGTVFFGASLEHFIEAILSAKAEPHSGRAKARLSH